MMRSGRLLAEESPEKLLMDYGLPSLEDVFLKLCIKRTGSESEVKLNGSVAIMTPSSDNNHTGIVGQNTVEGHDNMPVDCRSQVDNSEENIDQQRNNSCHLVPTIQTDHPAPTVRNTSLVFRVILIFLCYFSLCSGWLV